MKIVIIDGQGGRMEKLMIEQLKKQLSRTRTLRHSAPTSNCNHLPC